MAGQGQGSTEMSWQGWGRQHRNAGAGLGQGRASRCRAGCWLELGRWLRTANLEPCSCTGLTCQDSSPGPGTSSRSSSRSSFFSSSSLRPGPARISAFWLGPSPACKAANGSNKQLGLNPEGIEAVLAAVACGPELGEGRAGENLQSLLAPFYVADPLL